MDDDDFMAYVIAMQSNLAMQSKLEPDEDLDQIIERDFSARNRTHNHTRKKPAISFCDMSLDLETRRLAFVWDIGRELISTHFGITISTWCAKSKYISKMIKFTTAFADQFALANAYIGISSGPLCVCPADRAFEATLDYYARAFSWFGKLEIIDGRAVYTPN